MEEAVYIKHATAATVNCRYIPDTDKKRKDGTFRLDGMSCKSVKSALRLKKCFSSCCFSWVFAKLNTMRLFSHFWRDNDANLELPVRK